jgi:hypothetical protein
MVFFDRSANELGDHSRPGAVYQDVHLTKRREHFCEIRDQLLEIRLRVNCVRRSHRRSRSNCPIQRPGFDGAQIYRVKAG